MSLGQVHNERIKWSMNILFRSNFSSESVSQVFHHGVSNQRPKVSVELQCNSTNNKQIDSFSLRFLSKTLS